MGYFAPPHSSYCGRKSESVTAEYPISVLSRATSWWEWADRVVTERGDRVVTCFPLDVVYFPSPFSIKR